MSNTLVTTTVTNNLVAIKKLDHYQELPLPSYATIDSAGMDLMAAIPKNEPTELAPKERKLIPTGIAIALPKGCEAQVRPRSGLAIKNGITVTNAPGTIDADYRGEIFVSLINLSDTTFTITRGMRIAQIIIARYERINWNITDNLDETARGIGGFGSTGLQAMFGRNPILAPENNDGTKLKIHSIFDTIQSKGPYAGLPATIFIRLFGCNLACSICDTEFDEYNGMTLSKILAAVNNLILLLTTVNKSV